MKDTRDAVHIGIRADVETREALQAIADRKYEGVISMAVRVAITEYIARETVQEVEAAA